MKKFLSLFLGLAVLFAFTGCSVDIDWGNEEEEVVEPEMEEVEEEVEEEEEEEPEEEEEEPEEEEYKDEEPPANNYSGANYITLNSPQNEATMSEAPVIFSGVVSPNTTKLVVTASGGNKDCSDGEMCFHYWEDVYRLQDFNYGDKSFTYRANEDWDNLKYGSNDYEFKAYFDDSTVKSTHLTIFYNAGVAEMGKPVIYLYPEETMAVFVDVEPTDGISISDPELGDGWDVIATPDGKIFNHGDNKVYPYLFWEGFSGDFETPEEGFVISQKEVTTFFDEKLSILGMNEVEIADFKEYWVPILNEDPYYFITFVPQEDFDKYAPLTVTPEPDSVIRVFFDYKGLETPVRVTNQKLETPEREGFTLVEWGGRIYR